MGYEQLVNKVKEQYRKIITQKNTVNSNWYNGIVERYTNPVLTAGHVPLTWRYDFNRETNPYFMERIGVNAVFNAGAIILDGAVALVARVEGVDRKSYFAVARSENGVDNFVFDKYPVQIPETKDEVNVYDMRLTKHEDGYIYGLFCSEKKDTTSNDLSAAIAECGIVRTKDLKAWERLPNLKTKFQQRNVVLHPEFVDGKYMLYTRPSAGFVDVGTNEGIGCAYVEDIANAVVREETIIDKRAYHTIKEQKNGAGAPPIKTEEGWLHIAHGVRNTAAGLRYVLYCFMTKLDAPQDIKYSPGGYFMAPVDEERIGDVSNVLFCNGAVKTDHDEIFIYYASSDTRLHVAKTTVARMIDYCKNTPVDRGTTSASVEQIYKLIGWNENLL